MAKNSQQPAVANSAGSLRFRQRKISTKSLLRIYTKDQLPSLDKNELEPSQVHNLKATDATQARGVDTGVDKSEEDEIHLQQVINAAQKALLSNTESSAVYIPTPNASRIWPDAAKYYKQKFQEPHLLIKFSFTVEDAVGVGYNMDEEDEQFYTTLVKKHPKNTPSELQIEAILDCFENSIQVLQPFLSMDPSNILSYKDIYQYACSLQDKGAVTNPYVKTPTPTELIKLLNLFGKDVYTHWKDRKIKRLGRSIQPTLKFEDPSANDDNDPYVCFRRREFRQARKTRRADTIGADRIRQMQRSMNKAKELIANVSERETLKLENLQAEYDLFKLRCQTKSCKRELEVKGDDYLFFPHKKRKIIKIKEEEEEREKRKERKRQEQEASAKQQSLQHQQQQQQLQQQQLQQQQQQQQQQESTNQPYVKLPPAKIPDMDLVTVSLVLKEKNETIKRAVMEKLRKRRDHDRGFINLTDDPYQPYFDISNNRAQELSHIPYSSIAATFYHQFNTSNYIGEPLKKLLEEEKPLPGVKTFLGANGELIPSKGFPHTLSLMQEPQKSQSGYIERLLESVEAHDFSSYTNGFKNTDEEPAQPPSLISFPERIRKRVGRGGRMFLDYQRHYKNEYDRIFGDDPSTDGEVKDIYCEEDSRKRLQSKWRFDTEFEAPEPFSLDPSKLNGISPSTQSIRFGSMLLNRTRK
ncbi:Enhancer of polycomb-like protein 1 [Candida viswanathii]|uniref:Enhancer of polycomb-like protein n=1 Tax=Candida viswanathii TaxID=5486 RepID=A0A367YAZ2_9ASCO|nr:Enhancer of polycomb-like protein 1 [Candida viswanathii]